MVTVAEFRTIAMGFPEVTEAPHFEKTSFRIANKIFATLNIAENRATIKLSEAAQDLFCLNKKLMVPVPNKWGKQGWTHIDLSEIPLEMCSDAVKTSYLEVAPKRLTLNL